DRYFFFNADNFLDVFVDLEFELVQIRLNVDRVVSFIVAVNAIFLEILQRATNFLQ
ncbi:unnamed protein product, partial [marine sediment metagenome]